MVHVSNCRYYSNAPLFSDNISVVLLILKAISFTSNIFIYVAFHICWMLRYHCLFLELWNTVIITVLNISNKHFTYVGCCVITVCFLSCGTLSL